MSKASREHINFAITALFRPEDVVELRIPKAGRLRTISGYFDDFGKLAVIEILKMALERL